MNKQLNKQMASLQSSMEGTQMEVTTGHSPAPSCGLLDPTGGYVIAEPRAPTGF